ncbi:MAG: hypothetical protein A2Y62_04935 [Candidatus Fischerbacteria bacterium RBG_13_37_8]|uniref:Uncharacterized protein n=1 Tax=Candidatus Fischerbacteria bacterium RBG_13_37_8 TaxID=1817863 RepID=A0A1F5VKB8_9BACT|nr:MAG: hypothetical protein A2Y62_04935 [Candidatus Fischerbacteria bacterium RBG_13_37_8]
MKKIVLYEPKSSGYNIYSMIKVPRLGLAILGAILKEAGYDVTIFAEDITPPDFETILRADAVGISTLTCTTPRAYAIADIIRQNSRATVFMGGPHVSFMPEEALEHCDFVLRGEADMTIVPFMKALTAGTGFEKIAGLSFKDALNGSIVNVPEHALLHDLDKIPSPDLSLYAGKIDKIVSPIMTSRGCPWDCTFCSVTKMFGRGYRTNSVDRVISDIKSLLTRGNDWLFFYDDNFSANPKRTKAILKRVLDEKLEFKWGAQVRAEIARDHELLDLMKRTGAERLYIGFESINPETLECFNKKQTLQDIEKAIHSIHGHGINIHGMFVVGSDSDDQSVVSKTVDFAIDNELATIQLMALVPLPGTVIFDQIQREGRILTYDWSKYDAHYVTFKPLQMSAIELQWEILKGFMKFYSWKEVVKRFNSFDLKNSVLKIYGHFIVNNWKKFNLGWFDVMKGFGDGLAERSKHLQLSVKEAAQDVCTKVELLARKYGHSLTQDGK